MNPSRGGPRRRSTRSGGPARRSGERAGRAGRADPTRNGRAGRARTGKSDGPRSTARSTRSQLGLKPAQRFDKRTRPATAPELDRLVARQPWHLLRAPLERAGADVERALAQLKRYAHLALEWNRGVSNIISRNDEPRFVERHLVESITPASWLKESGARHWLDFGAGAGLPAIPLAIAGVGEHWILVESRRTKTLFLRKVLEHFRLSGFEVVHDRLENAILHPPVASGQDGFCSRATMPLGPTLALAAPIVRPGGVAFLWKGSGYEREMDEDHLWRESWDPGGLERVGTGPNVVAKFVRK